MRNKDGEADRHLCGTADKNNDFQMEGLSYVEENRGWLIWKSIVLIILGGFSWYEHGRNARDYFKLVVECLISVCD